MNPETIKETQHRRKYHHPPPTGKKEALKHIHKIQENAKDLWETFLESLAEYYVEMKNKPKKQVILNIKNSETTHSKYKRIQCHLKGSQKATLDRIIVDNNQGEPEEIFQYILQHNKNMLISKRT